MTVVLLGLLVWGAVLVTGPRFRPASDADLPRTPDVGYACWHAANERIAPREIAIEGHLQFATDGEGLWRITGVGVDQNTRYDVTCMVRTPSGQVESVDVTKR